MVKYFGICELNWFKKNRRKMDKEKVYNDLTTICIIYGHSDANYLQGRCEVNVNMNEVDKFSKGYGGSKSGLCSSNNQMGARMTEMKKSVFCKPDKNLEHISSELRARLQDFFSSYSTRLSGLLGIPVEELY